MNIISDIEWREFVDDGIVSQDIIDIISIRIKYDYELTDRELAIYKEKSLIIENNIKNYFRYLNHYGDKGDIPKVG